MIADVSKGSANASEKGLRWIRRLVSINLGLVALQALSAGFYMSGYHRAIAVHAAVAMGLQLGVLIQAVTAIVLLRRRRVPGWVASVSLGLFVVVFLQIGFGYTRRNWLHVPIGVGLFGFLTRQ